MAGTVAGAGVTVVNDRRPLESIIEDEIVELRATDAIYSDKVIGKHVRINITSFNGIVLLTGEAPSADMRVHAGNVVYSMRNVREIYNEVQIKKPISVEQRAADTWLNAKVKSILIANRGLLTRARVVTSDGVVYLMGLVSPEEADQIKDKVNKIKGITSTVALFEPLPSDISDVLRNSSKSIRQANTTPSDGDVRTSDDKELTVIPFKEQTPIQLTDGENTSAK
ncbi:MAG: BON domain-containing protein [Gammaproteobacteria bacterium]|nr:BON domain-containing protein [Gammaproteobacteria bacterium]